MIDCFEALAKAMEAGGIGKDRYSIGSIAKDKDSILRLGADNGYFIMKADSGNVFDASLAFNKDEGEEACMEFIRIVADTLKEENEMMYEFTVLFHGLLPQAADA